MRRLTPRPVFLDPAGRRWRAWRRGLLALGVVTTMLALAVAVGVLIPPFVPQLHIVGVATAKAPRFVGTRAERERIALRRRLRASTAQRVTAPARRRGEIPPARGTAGVGRRVRPARPIVAGFYVNWEDNSLDALRAHIHEMDWVVCEWAFTSRTGDSIITAIDPRVFDIVRSQIPDSTQRPAIHLQFSNFDTTSKKFSPTALRTMLSNPGTTARVIVQLRDLVLRNDLAGVTVDFEDVPPDLNAAVVEFDQRLRAVLAPIGRQVTQAVPAGMKREQLRAIAGATDYIFAMVFDEHYQGGDPGPVASQQFYEEKARQIVATVPPSKVIMMLGAYGYHWNDATGHDSSETQSFQEVMRAAREHDATVQFDTVSLNPFLAWTDPDSTDHVIWYLDAVTAFNETRVGDSLGVAGQAVWRLGGDDARIWKVLGRNGGRLEADSLRTLEAGYDVEFVPAEGGGEILQITHTPTTGVRSIRLDTARGLITSEHVSALPSPYVVKRYGTSEHRVALTFDDGPDGRWTPQLLDTLRSRHAPATFFVIGQNVERHFPLMRRIYREGHEIGNHTFFHPNLALVGDARTRLELDADARAIEAAIDRRSAFFRPPYFGDATPTTADELDPVHVASERGYYTIGLKIDAEDWLPIPVDSIVHNVLLSRDSGNVVLLHDGGGDRSRTVAALGPIIDSLRARGDTLVLVSALVGVSREEAMPPLPRLSEARRYLELGGFWLLGAIEYALYWIFTVAVVLGIGRLVLIGSLAFVQRMRSHQTRGGPAPYTPSVSVVVPAYNEGKVILGTIASLLRQDYAGPLEIVVVDDGSTDETLSIVTEAFDDEPRVTILHKPNGGKSSALNFGIERAEGEIVVGLDADTIFVLDTVSELVQPLADPRVGAVAGNAKVGNRINIVTRWQALEYVTSQNLDRRAFSLVDGITVVPGAVGAWRKSTVLQLGGFSADTLTEDQDLTMSVLRAGYSVAYADGAIAYTEAPDTLKSLAKQRYRWSFGTLQCAWKHRDTLFRSRYGSLGWIAMPNTWLFQLLLPAISPVADLLFLFSLVSVYATLRAHGSTYALTDLEQVLSYYAVFLLVDWLAAVIAFLMESGEEKQLTWLIFLQRFAYRQVMYWVVVRSFVAALTGRVVGWGKLERKATVAGAAGLPDEAAVGGMSAAR